MPHSPISSKKYILVADDSADDFMLVRIAFSRAGLPHQLIYLRRADHVISYLKGLEPFGDRTLYPFVRFRTVLSLSSIMPLFVNPP